MERASFEAMKAMERVSGGEVSGARLEHLSEAMSYAEAEIELASILGSFGYETMSMPDQESLLRSLITSFGQTIGDTSMPVENGNRFIVEVIGKKLAELEDARRYLARQLEGSVSTS